MKLDAGTVKTWLKDPYYVALLAILAGAAVLRLQYAFFEGMWVDEARYSRIGTEISKHLLEYSVASEWHGKITKFPPVYTYLIAFSTYIFGNNEFAVRIVSPVMGVAGVALTYLLGREMESREIGLISAALLAVNPIFWFLSERILIGATFATFYTAAILALYLGMEDRKYSRYALWSLGPLVAINIMTKQPGYTLGLVIPIYFLYRHREELMEFIVEGTGFRESGLYDVLTEKNYYITAGLGFLSLLPWMLRNLAVCSFPLCGMLRALDFAATENTAAWASTNGPFFYLLNMPSIVTIAGATLIGFRAVQYMREYAEKDADRSIKAVSFVVLMLVASYFVKPDLVAMVLLTSVAIFARSDAEKLLWLWTGIGIGFMALGRVQVPRYVVFVIPALTTLAAISLYSVSGIISRQLESKHLTQLRVAALLLLPVLFLSFTQGLVNVSRGGYAQLEPAGKWLDENAADDSTIVASSAAQMRYYVYPRMAYQIPKNQSRFKRYLREKNASYVEVDIYERAQAKWAQTGIPPYRLPVSLRQELRAGKVSPRQVANSYGQAPDYLEPVKQFGRTRVPLTRNQAQPMVIIYKVNITG